jgi:transposase
MAWRGACVRRWPRTRWAGQFVFRNRRGTAIKLLAYDGQGVWLCHKRLSQGRFRHWPTGQPGQALAAHELAVLLAGGDRTAAAGAPVWRAVA